MWITFFSKIKVRIFNNHKISALSFPKELFVQIVGSCILNVSIGGFVLASLQKWCIHLLISFGEWLFTKREGWSVLNAYGPDQSLLYSKNTGIVDRGEWFNHVLHLYIMQSQNFCIYGLTSRMKMNVNFECQDPSPTTNIHKDM